MKEPSTQVADHQRARTALFVFQVAFVAALLAVWIVFSGIRDSKSLWVLFLYSFPSQFTMAPVPHEPVLLYFSKFYDPWTVTWVAVAGTLLTEWINYSVSGYISDRDVLQRPLKSRTVQTLVYWFSRAPFATLCFAGFAPIPFYPFRFLTVIANYPLWKYLLAILVSRTPRFWILCVLGAAINFSDTVLVTAAVVLIILGIAPVGRMVWKRGKRRLSSPPS